jgi:hypothetical protein
MRSKMEIKNKKINYGIGALTCLLNVVVLSSCTPSSSTSGGSTTAAIATTTTVIGPTINSFLPAAGSVTTMPTSVQVQFSETTLNAGTVTNTQNWNYVCSSSSTIYYPTSVMLSSGLATVILPAVTVTQGASCTLTATANILDTSSNALSGTTTATYQAQNDGVTFVGSFPNISANDRLYQYSSTSYKFVADVYPSAVVYNGVTIKNVQFLINNIPLGTSTETASGTYAQNYGEFTLTQNLTQLPTFFTGKVTLSVVVTDSNGVVSTPANVSIEMSKNPIPTSTSWSAYDYPQNGVGGTISNDALAGYLLYGFTYSVTDLVRGIVSEYAVSSTGIVGAATVLGTSHGQFSNTNEVSCITDLGANYRAVGVFGVVSNNQFNDILQMGLYCQDVTNPGSAIQKTTSQIAGSDGVLYNFSLQCQPGAFVVDVDTDSGDWLDRVRINCQ